jgi:YbbR domain-containing protein
MLPEMKITDAKLPDAKDALQQPTSDHRRRRGLLGLVDQVGTILLSLALAVVIWLVAVNQKNPLTTDTLADRIPVTVRGLDASLQPVQDLSKESLRVTLRAPRDAWDDLGADDFTASVDLTNLGEGTHDVPIIVDVTDPRVTILDRSPPNLRIQLDPLVTKAVSVTVELLDAPAFGYDNQTPVVEPAVINVFGPASQVDLVTQVVAPVVLTNAKSQVESTVDVRPLSRQNQPVSGVTLDNSFVRVVVPVERWPGRKEVAVRINLVGQPAPGYRLSTVRAEPSTVVLEGNSDVLAAVAGYIETVPLSIDSATSDIRQRLDLVVPEGVSLSDSTPVLASVSITPIEGGSTVTVRPIVQGLGADLEATVSPETVDVILSGPIPMLESLNSDDMYVFLDLSGLLPGTHVVTPRVVLPEGIGDEGVLPQTVEVVIGQTNASIPADGATPSALPSSTPQPVTPPDKPTATPPA